MQFEFLWRRRKTKKKIQTGSKIILCTLPILFYTDLRRRRTPYWRARARNIPTIYRIVGIAPAGPVFSYFYNSVYSPFFILLLHFFELPYLCTIHTYKYIYIYIYAYATNAGMTRAAVYVEKNAISHARTNFVLNAPTLLFAANSSPPFVNRVMVTVLYATQSMQTDSAIFVARSWGVFRHYYIIISSCFEGPDFSNHRKYLFPWPTDDTEIG